MYIVHASSDGIISSSHLIFLLTLSLSIVLEYIMIGLSFDTELNRDIGVGYVGRKVDVCFLKYVHPTNRAN